VKFQPGDVIDVVIEREEPEGGYLASYERAQRLRVWDAIEKAAADKTPMMGTVVSRVQGRRDGGHRAEGIFCPARNWRFARSATLTAILARRLKFASSS